MTTELSTTTRFRPLARGVAKMTSRRRIAALAGLAAPLIGVPDPILAQDLASFAILAGQSVTNTGATTITGNIGISPGNTITGAGSIVLTGTIYAGDDVALQAQNDLATLYNFLALRPTSIGGDLTGQDLGNFGALNPLTAGVYNFDSSAFLNGNLVLDAEGDPDAIFIFNIGSTLITGSGSSVQLINQAQGGNVFFRVGSSATLFTSTTFAGQIVALTSITLQTTAAIQCGAALARNGSVTLDTNTIAICVLEVEAGEIGDEIEEGDTPPGDNAEAVADALDAYIAAFGPLPPGFAILAAALTPEQLAAALSQLAGQGGSAVAFSTTQGMDSFLSLALGGRGEGGMRVAPGNDGPTQDDNTVSTLGYWDSTARDGSALGAFDDLSSGAPSQTWDIWMSSYGGFGLVSGDANTGTQERATLDYGIAGGVDFLVGPGTRLGLALGWGGTQFSLANDMGSGRSGVVQLAVHARADSDAAYLTGGLAYSYSDVSTARHVTIAGDDRFAAEFGAHNLAGEIEAGYRMEWLTPYVAVRGHVFHAPAYSETTVSGQSTYALDYASQTMLTARTELGVRVDWKTIVGEATELSLHAGAAWTHDVRSGASMDASFQALGLGSSFAIVGATPTLDSILLNAGAEIDFGNGLALAGALDGEFTQNAVTYGGSLTLSHSW